MAQLVDWDLARQTGSRLVPAGPAATEDEAYQLVTDLREAADRAIPLAREATHLNPPELPSATFVVDRRSWIQANCETMSAIMGSESGSVASATAAGLETGALLALLAPRVLGQFDPFCGDGGRLLLNAPNVLHISRQLRADQTDFCLWVCLHEETHRLQFHSAPWLVEYLLERLDAVLAAVTLGVSDVAEWVRSCISKEGSTLAFLDLFVNRSQRKAAAEIAAVMTLLEGHADVMMDQVGIEVIPTLATIREQFDERREDSSTFLGRLLGMDAKRQQYRDGSAFCRAVIDRVGVDGFNLAFAGPTNLPTMTEIRSPEKWLDRVGNQAA